MLKRIALALGLMTTTATADMIQIQIPCDPSPVVYDLMRVYKNGLLLQGNGTIKSENGAAFTSATQIFINQDTGTMAVIITFPNEDKPPMSCLIIAGSEFEPYGGPQPWDNKKEDL
jgi:hypothetical protein